MEETSKSDSARQARMCALAVACVRDAEALRHMDLAGIDLDAGIDDPWVLNKLSGDAPDSGTPLNLAIWGRNAEAVRYLLARGANPNRAGDVAAQWPDDGEGEKMESDGGGALHVLAIGDVWDDTEAAEAKGAGAEALDAAVARALLEGGARADTEDAEGQTALFLSGPAVSRVLLEEGGAAVDHRDHHGLDPLAFLLRYHLAMPDAAGQCRVLVEHGASVNDIVEDDTPLSLLVRNAGLSWREEDVLAIAEALVAAGGDVRVRLGNGDTPLHRVGGYGPGAGKMVRLLVRHGADLEACNHEGFTPLGVARSLDVAQALIECGADPMARLARGAAPDVGELVAAARAQVRLKNGRAGPVHRGRRRG